MDWSTNKRVKAKTSTSMGTAYRTASGSKRVKPGSKNTTSAKRVPAYETIEMKHKKKLKRGVYDPSTGSTLRKYNKKRAI
jgi:hypothetical protein